MEARLAVIIITIADRAPANAPEPPLRPAITQTDAALSFRALRGFDAFASLDADIQRALWRFHASRVRAARRPVPAALRDWPSDGDAA